MAQTIWTVTAMQNKKTTILCTYVFDIHMFFFLNVYIIYCEYIWLWMYIVFFVIASFVVFKFALYNHCEKSESLQIWTDYQSMPAR